MARAAGDDGLVKVREIDGTDLEGTVVAGGFGDLVAVTTANYR